MSRQINNKKFRKKILKIYEHFEDELKFYSEQHIVDDINPDISDVNFIHELANLILKKKRNTIEEEVEEDSCYLSFAIMNHVGITEDVIQEDMNFCNMGSETNWNFYKGYLLLYNLGILNIKGLI